jgi:hypothetical protein
MRTEIRRSEDHTEGQKTRRPEGQKRREEKKREEKRRKEKKQKNPFVIFIP